MGIAASYLFWHFVWTPQKIIKIAANFIVFFYYYFSVGLLLRSLFAPWKRLTIKRGRAFKLDEFFHVLSFNLISRFVGFIVRMMVIFAWLVMEVVAILFFSVSFLVFIILPGLTFPLFLLTRKAPDPVFELIEKGVENPKEIFEFLAKTRMSEFLFSRLGFSEEEVEKLATSTSGGSIQLATPGASSSHAFYLLAKTFEPFKKLLFEKELDEEDVLAVCQWFERTEEQEQKQARFWELENLLTLPGIGKDWAYGYTVNLDKYSEDLAQPFSFTHHLVGREKETQRIEQVLSRATDNNVLLVGQPGVGRNTIMYEFARRVKEGRVAPALTHKRVLSLDLNAILGTSKSPAQTKSLVAEVLKEAASAGNIILVIDNFDQYVSTGSGRTDLSDLFKEASAKGNLQIIGITTPTAFQKYIYPNAEMTKILEKVEVGPPTPEQALIILQDTTPLYEARNNVLVLYQALVEIIEKVDQYVVDIPFPEKAIDLLDETCAISSAKLEKKIITPVEVNEVLAEKTKIPLGEIKKEEKEKLENLEEVLHKRIVDQEIAVAAIARAMRRARIGIAERGKPIGTFLFLGPTGVGKTETAKALAEAYFGDEKRMIRFDMSEYQGRDGLQRVIGSQEGSEPGLMASAIRKNPFSLLLLDEIEKAHREVLNLFLVMLDEGFFTDVFGQKIDCQNLIIIGTSNAGSEFIRQELTRGLKEEELSEKVLDFVQKEGIFTPEFLNRFDAVVVYKPLGREELKAVAKLLLGRLNKRLAEKDLSLKITQELVDKVVELGYSPTLGARPMNRVIADKIEDQIAQMILKGEVKRGQEVEISLD